MMAIEREETDIQQALRDLQAGEVNASDRLMFLIRPQLMGIARAMLGSSAADPEDAVQASLLALLIYLDKTPDFTGKLMAFASTVVANCCRDMLRRELRHPQVPITNIEGMLSAGIMDEMDRMIEDEVKQGLEQAMMKLEAPCRKLLVDIYYRQRSFKELMESLGLTSVQAVYSRRKQCLIRLRKIFENSL